MRLTLFVTMILVILLAACQPGVIPVSSGADRSATPSATASLSIPPSATPSSTSTIMPAAVSTATPTPSPTAEPVGVIRVDTLQQEVYPYPENGNCTLAEAISAANLLKPVDACAAGVESGSVIELMSGTYPLEQVDPAPPQDPGVFHFSPTGSALPILVRPITLHGNGAVLSRQASGSPFRILEILKGEVTIQDLTLQGGDAGPDDWGGAIRVENAVLHLERVRFLHNQAENGAGLYVSMGDVTLVDSEFSENKASQQGGGVYFKTVNASLKNVRFLNNQSKRSGGGLYAQRVTLELSDSLFKDNVSQEGNGGGVNIEGSSAAILRCQFYHNVARIVGGAAAFSILSLEEDIRNIEADPMEALQNDPTFQQSATQIPGFTATLQAAPGGMYRPIKYGNQVHDSCFVGNETRDPNDPNWASALSGNSKAENNYYGDASGPGGKGPGTGDEVGRKVIFTPFLTQPPAHCDLSLAR